MRRDDGRDGHWTANTEKSANLVETFVKLVSPAASPSQVLERAPPKGRGADVGASTQPAAPAVGRRSVTRGFMKQLAFFAAAAALALPAIATASSQTVTVLGQANPFLAAQPSGSCCGGNSAPGQSPALAATGLASGQVLTFSATGGVSYAGGAPAAGADGDNDGTNYTYRFSMTADYETGIAGAQNVNVDGLVGVFVSGMPGGAAPSPLDFAGMGASTGLDFASLTPGNRSDLLDRRRPDRYRRRSRATVRCAVRGDRAVPGHGGRIGLGQQQRIAAGHGQRSLRRHGRCARAGDLGPDVHGAGDGRRRPSRS